VPIIYKRDLGNTSETKNKTWDEILSELNPDDLDISELDKNLIRFANNCYNNNKEEINRKIIRLADITLEKNALTFNGSRLVPKVDANYISNSSCYELMFGDAIFEYILNSLESDDKIFDDCYESEEVAKFCTNIFIKVLEEKNPTLYKDIIETFKDINKRGL